MNKTLFGLALLSYNWDKFNKDIIDSYIPLVCNCIRNKKHNKVTRENVQDDLIDFYGISIPLGAIESILKRMAKNNLLNKQAGEWLINYDKVCEGVKEIKNEELDFAFKELVDDLTKFSQEMFSVQLSIDEIESGIITFFKEYDLDLLFASTNGDSVLPQVRESKKAKYIISKFIIDLQSKDQKKFKTVLKLAKGHAIASLITYEDIQHYSGSLNNVEIYLDAPIIFNLLGLNGESNQKLSKELIETILKNNANLKIFDLNYVEVIKTIQDAIKRLSTGNFDITRSSRILRTAIRKNISSQQLQIKLNQLDSMLKKFSINKSDSPTLKESEYMYQVDLQKLQTSIEDLYKKDESYKIPWYKVNQIERDVESISNIFKIRKRTQAISLKNSKAILLTSNEVIAFAAKKYERSDWEFKSTIPVCVTDIFLSTILWANYPTKSENLNIKRLISECSNIIELDNHLLNKFYEDINRMHEENQITDEQFFLLSASNLTYSLLEQKTLNDIDEYTDKTPSEILEDLQLRISADLNNERGKLTRIDNNIRNISKYIAKTTFIFFGVFLICLSLIFKSLNPHLNTNWFNIIAWGISSIFGVFGLMRWMELIPPKLKIENSIAEYIFNKLKRLLNK
ncbi:MAG: hypothetical protein ISS19_16555 [Bacteroidales bacterium]|nr:hypothetical protein [Bacteroidales bacterium]